MAAEGGVRVRASSFGRNVRRVASFDRGHHTKFLFVCEQTGRDPQKEMHEWVNAIRLNTVHADMRISAPKLQAGLTFCALVTCLQIIWVPRFFEWV